MPSYRHSVRSVSGAALGLASAGRIVGSTYPVAIGLEPPAAALAALHEAPSYTLQVPARVSRRSTATPARTVSTRDVTVDVVVGGSVVADVVVADVIVADVGEVVVVGDVVVVVDVEDVVVVEEVVGGIVVVEDGCVDVVGASVVGGVVDVVVVGIDVVDVVEDVVVVVGGADPALVIVKADGDVTTGS